MPTSTTDEPGVLTKIFTPWWRETKTAQESFRHANSYITVMEPIVNTASYKKLLLAKEKELSGDMGRERETAREQSADSTAHDLGDDSLRDEEKEMHFAEADMDREALIQVRDALKRIEDGTYGKCGVDGRPIDEKRLKQIPWTPFCLKHQEELESAKSIKTPTL